MPESPPVIRPITAAASHALRLPILRTGLPAESAIFPGDDAPDTLHLGAFRHDALVGIATLMRTPLPERLIVTNAWQLRGMATLPAVRGHGFGSALLRACLEHARTSGGALLWCNARLPAVPFYLKHGLQQTGEPFEIPTAGPHLRLWIDLGRG